VRRAPTRPARRGLVRSIRDAGILGINRRNREYVQAANPRRQFPTVDDKIRTKVLCERAGVATPALHGVVGVHSELRRLGHMLDGIDSFAIKPAHGAQGNGILVVTEREGDRFRSAGGRRLGLADVRYRIAEILSGLFSLGGQPDRALVEECLTVHPALARICSSGVPDIRVVVYRGLPAMAMVRLPSRRSAGRANLHQGAIGAGVDLASGRLSAAVQKDRYVERHPDTGEPIVGLRIPDFDAVLRQTVRAASAVELGYVGVDIVLDEERGPVVLELNARPGLSIQIANRAGLLPRLDEIDGIPIEGITLEDRVELGRSLARGWEDRAGDEAAWTEQAWEEPG